MRAETRRARPENHDRASEGTKAGLPICPPPICEIVQMRHQILRVKFPVPWSTRIHPKTVLHAGEGSGR